MHDDCQHPLNVSICHIYDYLISQLGHEITGTGLMGAGAPLGTGDWDGGRVAIIMESGPIWPQQTENTLVTNAGKLQ